MGQVPAGAGNRVAAAAVEPDVPTPLSVERVAALLKQRGYVFFIDSTGRLGGNWEDVIFYFLLHGDDDVLHVRAQYPGTVSTVHLEAVREVTEASHRSFPVPQACYRIDDDGAVRVFASHAVSYEHGVTDAQILQHIDCAIASVLRLFGALDVALGR